MITISLSAKTKIIDLLTEENDPLLSLRTFVQGGGCSGMTYGFTFDNEQNEDDFEIPLEQFKVYMSANSTSNATYNATHNEWIFNCDIKLQSYLIAIAVGDL